MLPVAERYAIQHSAGLSTKPTPGRGATDITVHGVMARTESVA